MDLTGTARGNAFGSFVLAAGLLFVMMPVLSFCISSLGFIAGLSITIFHFPVLALISVLFAFIVVKQVQGNVSLTPFLFAILLFALLSIWGMLHLNGVYDTSYDGTWYHQEAILNLYRGWNPYYKTLTPEDGSLYGPFYVNHYPKAAWIAEGVIYVFTNKIETAKVVNLWMATGLLFISLYVFLLLKKIPLWLAVSLSILLGLNPVSLYQFYSFYVDGILGASLMIMIFLLASRIFTSKKIFTVLALLVFVFVANIKFTGLVYGVIILAFYLLYLLWKRQSIIYDLTSMFVAGLFAVLVMGYPTYVTNTITHKHPFFPIMGPESFGDVIAAIPQPANFKDKNRFEKFGIALFAEPVWSRSPLETRPKHLFKPVSDKQYFTRPDFELSGLGPYQAEIFLLFSVAIILLLVLKIPYKGEILFLLFLLFCSTFINSEVWYARYAPHLWLLGIILTLALYQHKLAKYVSLIITAALLFNIAYLAVLYVNSNIHNSIEAHRQIDALKKLNRPASIVKGWQVTFETRAKEAGLDYQFVNLDSTYKEAEYSIFSGFHGESAKFKLSELEEGKKGHNR